MATIRNPIEWSYAQLRTVFFAVEAGVEAIGRVDAEIAAPLPAVRRITIADLADVLALGFQDFGASRSDVVFVCLIYPVVGLVLGRLLIDHDMLPLILPLASGFALVGPFAAVGLYEMSRRRERGIGAGWSDALKVVGSPAFGSIALLGTLLIVVFLAWLAVAKGIYNETLGPQTPVSLSAFAHDVFTTEAGWALIIGGCGAGFLFAVFVLVLTIVSFPMLVDRDVGVARAVRTSIRAVARNPVPIAAWGAIVAALLILGSLPLLIGLVVVLPVLCHASWHLYRKLVP